MFPHKIRNIFCVPETKFVSARANGGTFVSATMCPRLPGPYHDGFATFLSPNSAEKKCSQDNMMKILREKLMETKL